MAERVGTAGASVGTKVESSQAASHHQAMGEWRVIGETVPGASHLRAGVPNQDAILQMRESSVGLPLILSISDGHGSDKCFRSVHGSRFAVAIGADLLREMLNGIAPDADPAQLESSLREALPARFTSRWNETVAADLERKPLSKEELDRLELKDGAQARQTVEAHPTLAYGATTLSVVLTHSLVIYLQLGDGEILTIAETGEVTKPLPEDERLLANETTSLCSQTAAQDFRFACRPLGEPAPALILLTTDGYANSFADDTGFLKAGSDILELLRTEGFDAVNQSVKGWLEEATRLGSGDDCTLGIILRMDALQSSAPAGTQAAEAETLAAPVSPTVSAPSVISANNPEAAES
jgi:serine/threonine protein phosphatase PrpC